jgi:hypothetical protein
MPELIRTTLSTIDRYREYRRFKTVEGARKYALKKLGVQYDVGRFYAVSFDGVVKLEFSVPTSVIFPGV